MTYREHMLYCEAYRYSDENFNILKTIKEMQLQEHYLDSRSYMLEHYDQLAGINESCGLFQESVSEDELKVITEGILENIKEKGKAALDTIRKTIASILRKFVGFLNTLISKIAPSDSNESICKDVTTDEGKLTAEECALIVQEKKKMESEDEKAENIIVDNRDTRSTKITSDGKTVDDIKFDSKVPQETVKEVKEVFYVCYSDSVKVSADGKNVSDLNEINNKAKEFIDIFNGKKVASGVPPAVKANNGVIYVYPKKNDIEKSMNEIKDKCKVIENIAENNKEHDAQAVKNANEIVNDISTSVSISYDKYSKIMKNIKNYNKLLNHIANLRKGKKTAQKEQ